MKQLTNNIQWDESKAYEEQSNDCKNFVQNVIQTYDKVSEKEAIPMSDLYRITKAIYTLSNDVKITETYTYSNPVINAGWNELKSHKIECNG